MSIGFFAFYTFLSIALGWTLNSLYNYYLVDKLCSEIEEKDAIIRKLNRESDKKDSWRM